MTTFEPMAEQHRRDVMDIFNYYIENSYAAYLDRKLPEHFFDKFLQATEGYPAFVLRDGEAGEVVGFCFLRAYHPFPTFKRTAEITYFIKPDRTGQGLGTLALKKLEEEAKRIGLKTILASISSRNDGSLRFHQSHGFVECGRFRDVAEKNGVLFDVVWMQKDVV